VSRLNVPSVSALAKTLFGDHPNMAHYDLVYEIMEDLIPSDALLGDSEEGFTPDHFAGLVMRPDGIVFTALGYTFTGALGDAIDMIDLIGDMSGIAVSDSDLLELISYGTARTVASVGASSKDGVVTARIYWHPGIGKRDAIGFLKSAHAMALAHLGVRTDDP